MACNCITRTNGEPLMIETNTMETATKSCARIRCGDTVIHRPTGERWLVAHVDGEYLAWVGWPDGEARLSDCELVASCDDKAHLTLLRELAGSRSGRRASVAARTLEAMSVAEPNRIVDDIASFAGFILILAVIAFAWIATPVGMV